MHHLDVKPEHGRLGRMVHGMRAGAAVPADEARPLPVIDAKGPTR
ncbi:hypothetical protein OG285_36630 (plasmid) [Streptomyces sp. NBC_01471]